MKARHTGLDKPRALQRVLYRAAKEDAHRRFHSLYDKVARSDVLVMGWERVRANRGAPGVDGVSIADVEASGVDRFLGELAEALRSGWYRPRPLRRVHIPKAGTTTKTRPLGIPTVTDRVMMAAARWVLEPIFEADFLECSFGFRRRRSPHHAVEAVRVAVNAPTRGDWVLDADLAGCFDNISHRALLEQVSRRVYDRRMLSLIRSWLQAGVLRHHSGITDLPAARQRCAARLGRRVATTRAAAGGAGALRRRLHHRLPDRDGPRSRCAHARDGGLVVQPRQDPRRRSAHGQARLRLPRVPLPQSRVSPMARSLVLPTVAINQRHGIGAGQDPRRNHPCVRRPLAGRPGRSAQPHPARMGQLLRRRQLRPRVQDHRPIRLRTPGTVHQQEAQPPRTQVASPAQLVLVLAPRHTPALRTRRVERAACLPMNDVGEPCAGGSSRQGCDPAGESPAMSVVRVGHEATPHPGTGNRPGDAWCERPGGSASMGAAVGATWRPSERRSPKVNE
jgi:Reverse transcriptase (RNA-dependent DNA polymerase)